MKRFYHKLLSSIVSFMLIITASFVPELFNFSIANAAGTYQADSGVYSLELIGTSTNDHTVPHYLWENSGKIFVAFTVLNRSIGKIDSISVNGTNATTYDELPSSTNLVVNDSISGTQLLNQSSDGKVGSGYNWVVAQIQLPTSNVPSVVTISINITGQGHSLSGAQYRVVGGLNVYNEYPPTDPVLDDLQSLGSNSLGGIAAGTYLINPTPTTGYEYDDLVIKIDNVVIGTAESGSPFSYSFADGTINVSSSGVITLTLTKTSARVYEFIYSYQLSDYLLTIHYEYEDGSTAAPDYTDTLNYQDPYSVVSPTIPGYTPSLATVSGTMPASNRTVTVTYTAIDYTFTFVPNWGSVLNEVRSFNVGGSVIPPVFTRDGYTFKGWTLDQAGLNLYVDGFTNLTVGNKTVYAQWEAIDYTFTFVPNWGSELSVDRIFNVGGSVTPPVFTRTGFTFTGWSLDVEGTQTYTQFSNLTSGNKTVYAQWSQNNYSFTFDPNFGDGANVVQMFNFGGSVAGTSFTRLGYTFDGWTLDEAGLIPYTGGLTNLPAEDIYVYAQWEAIDYTFTFDPNFGDGANVVQSFNVGGSVAGTVFTRLGYTFDGWTLDEAGLIPYTGGLTNLPAEDIYVYAQWEAIDYTFTFDPNFGDGTNVVQVFNVGGSVAGTVFTRLGYTFDGWTLDEAGLTPYTGGLTDLPAENIYVYAQWEAIDYTFTFDPNFGDGANVVQSFNVGGSVAGTVFTRPGYTFDGWTLDEAGLTPYTGGLTNLPAENIYVYAQWEAIDYTFTFDPNFGDGANVVQGFTVGGSVVGTTFTRIGYTFIGWTLDEAGLTEYTGGLTDLPAENIYVYAQWEAVDYTFTFDPNFGDGANVVQVFNVGGSVAGTVFTRPGYTFDGWTLDEAGLTPYTGGLTDLPAENIYVYAQWEAIDYTFTFDPNFGEGANVVQSFNVGGSVAGTSFTRPGYTFIGWTADEEGLEPHIYGFDNLPPTNIYVYAQWEAIDYTFTFDPNFGDGANVVQVFNVGGSVAGTTFTRLGFTFSGWTLDEEGLTEYTGGLTDLPAENIYVYAQWEAIDYTFTFDPNFGDGANVVQVFNVGGSVEGTTFTRLGFTFSGWTLDEEGLTEYTGGLTDLPAENIYVYAQWEAIDYTFTFDPNFGDGANVVQVFNVGGSVAGTVFTRTGYTFDGWTLDEAGLTPYTGGLTDLPAENIYVYAQWEAIDYTFTFDPNFGDGANVVQSFNVGGSVAGTTFTRLGYTFDGWTLDEAGLTPYTGGLTDLPAENIYVYAQWEAIDYTFTFDPNFGDGANVVQGFNVGGSVAGTVFTRLGFTFSGWTLDEEGLIDYEGGLTDLPAENIYVYAQWEAIDYTFTFDPNFGDGANVVQGFNVGGSVAGTVFVREGFDFVGWTLDEEGLIDYEGGLTDLPAENIYVYAQWAEVLGEEDETFVLRFVTNMPGLTYFDIVFSAGDSITPPAPVVEGYDFLGWFIDEEFSELFEDFDNMPARDVTVFADWGEVLGEEEEIPQTSDNFNRSLAFFLFILGLLATTLVKKEEENV